MEKRDTGDDGDAAEKHHLRLPRDDGDANVGLVLIR